MALALALDNMDLRQQYQMDAIERDKMRRTLGSSSAFGSPVTNEVRKIPFLKYAYLSTFFSLVVATALSSTVLSPRR